MLKIFSEHVLQTLASIGTVAGCFILAHPYGGIVHDNVLYVAQALLRLYPRIYGGDAFFEWGSQDQFTLFSPVFAWLIGHFGLNLANIGLLLTAQALFLGGSFALVRILMPPAIRTYSLLFVVCGVGLYGGFFLFRMAEPFVTPRPFAEAATLFAAALLFRGRLAAAAALLSLAALLHPIMAFCGALYCWIFLLLGERRWLWLIGVSAVPLAAAFAGIFPFTQLLQTFDSEWLRMIAADNANVFLTQWSHLDWGLVIFDGAALFTAMHLAQGLTRRAFHAALGTAIVALAATFVFADLLHNVLLTSVQPWRALWLVHWIAAASVPVVAWHLWREGAIGRVVTGFLVFGFLTRGLPTSVVASLLAMLLFNQRQRISISMRIANLALVALAAGAFSSWLSIALRVYRLATIDSVNFISDFVVRALSKPFPLLVIGTGLTWLLLARRHTRIAAIAALAFVALAIGLWDQRLPFRIYMESTAIGSHPFSRIVKPDQEVLWHGNATAPWIMMQRRSYFSDTQMAGQVFSREMALQFARRKKAMSVLELQENLCNLMNSVNDRHDSCQPDLEVLRGLCRQARDLDYVVLQSRIADKWLASWTMPVAVGGQRQYFYLYGCQNLI